MKPASGGVHNLRAPSIIQIKERISLKERHTFGLPATARFFCEIENESSLLALLKSPTFRDNEHVFLGEGSNSLFMRDYPGIVVCLRNKGVRILSENDEAVCLRVSAGENWHEFVQYTLTHGYFGLENLSLIPGSVGAAPVQNIGAYGVEVNDFITHVEAIDVESAEVRTFKNKECGFSYRDSCFKSSLKNRYVITAVFFRLLKQPHLVLGYAGLREGLDSRGINNPTALDVSALVCEVRRTKLPDPKETGNAGSFFKHPMITESHYLKLKEIFPDIKSFELDHGRYKIPAGWLIERCGFKGRSIGPVGIYKKQALVLVNNGVASGVDVERAIVKITEKVKSKFDIILSVEPVLI